MNDTRRIVQLVPSLDQFGEAAAAARLAEGLAARGYEVHLIAVREGAGSAETAGLPISILSRRRGFDPTIWLKLREALRRLAPCVVHTFGPTAFNLGTTVSWTLGLQKSVATDPISSDRKSSVEVLIQKWSRHSCRIAVANEHARERLCALGVSRKQIIVIPPGIGSTEIAATTREEWLTQLELPADARLIGVADSLDAQSKTKEAIWAAELVYVLHKNSCLVVFGDGPRRGQLERFARLVDAGNRIRFLGNRDAARLFGLLDVFWSCGERDPAPPAMLQAMAAGAPVVASDIPGREQLIVDNKTGFLAGVGSRTDFARPTDRLYQDAELARRIGDAGRQHVAEAFSIEEMIDRYVDLYREL